MTQIYVYLLDEDVDVWRPVQAEHLGDDRYRISGQEYDSEDETWEFVPGTVVRCELRRFHDAEGLVAVEEATT